jgi:hypothetical protein
MLAASVTSRFGCFLAAADPRPGRIADVVDQVVGELFSQRPLKHRFNHLLEQAVSAEQLTPSSRARRDQRLGLPGIRRLHRLPARSIHPASVLVNGKQ